MLLCFHACAIYTVRVLVEKQRFTCFCAFGLCCVYLRSHESYQKSRYAVYVCFYVFQESQVAVCTCFYVFLDPAEAKRSPTGAQRGPKSHPRAPPEAQDKPNRGPERSIEPLGGPRTLPRDPRRPNRSPTETHRAHIRVFYRVFEAPRAAQSMQFIRCFTMFSRISRNMQFTRVFPAFWAPKGPFCPPVGDQMGKLYAFSRVFSMPMCNSHVFLRCFRPGSGRLRTSPDGPGRPRKAPEGPGCARLCPDPY